ncbi:MAG: hypothetical protein ABIF28_03360 [Pseudomonadota bacterium]
MTAGADTLELALRVVVVLKGLNELLLLTFIAQGALWLLAGSQRQHNLIYNAFNLVGARILAITRRITPRFVPDRHLPAVALFWLLLAELLLIIAKISLVLEVQARPAA